MTTKQRKQWGSIKRGAHRPVEPIISYAHPGSVNRCPHRCLNGWVFLDPKTLTDDRQMNFKPCPTCQPAFDWQEFNDMLIADEMQAENRRRARRGQPEFESAAAFLDWKYRETLQKSRSGA